MTFFAVRENGLWGFSEDTPRNPRVIKALFVFPFGDIKTLEAILSTRDYFDKEEALDILEHYREYTRTNKADGSQNTRPCGGNDNLDDPL